MQNKNLLVRILLPLVLIAVGLGIAYAVLQNSARSARQAPGGGTGVPTQAPAPGAPAAGAPRTQPPGPPPAPIAGLHAQTYDGQPEPAPLGSLDRNGPVLLRLDFSPIGAGIRELRLARHFDTIEQKEGEHTLIQAERWKDIGNTRPTLTPLGALGLTVNGTVVDLTGVTTGPEGTTTRRVWKETAPGRFEAAILDGEGRPVARVRREYILTDNSYDITLRQTVENLTASPMTVRLYSLGPVDLPADSVAYGGDKRRLRFGYLPDPTINPGRQFVASEDFLWQRETAPALGKRDKAANRYPAEQTVWPNERSAEKAYEPAWVGMTNRYFGVAVHPLVDPAAPSPDKSLHVDETDGVVRVLLDSREPDAKATVMGVRLKGQEAALAPGAAADMSVGVYAGPLSRPLMMRADARAAELVASGIEGLVVYNFGGPCSFCTFGWLTHLLLSLLHFLHDYILHDWGLAIIFLVVCVRTILHPVTKWSQIRVQRLGKQMQAMAPKQKAIQEKYGNDKKKMQEEMARLWKEEGINPAGALGCLPMFLQTPIWIALSAMLFSAFELRHQPAFFGIFQNLTGGKWWFLGDLAEPDRAIYFHKTLFTLPLLGPIDSFNILPFILAIVFYTHQKYLAPPSSAAMTPEQQQQQAMMKWMSVVMFPVMMYAAPSGLALYFIANSTIAIFESRYIRAHIDKHDLLNTKPGKPTGGFMKYLNDIADRQRQTLQNRFGQQRPARPGDQGPRRLDGPRGGPGRKR